MKVWKTAKFFKKDKNIELITRSYINYIYKYGQLTILLGNIILIQVMFIN